MIQWVKWPQKWTVYLQETHLHVSCAKKRLLRCSVVSCLRNSCSHGSVALSQATLGATVRVLRSEHVQTDIFIRLRRCRRKMSEGTSSRSPRGLCLLEYKQCQPAKTNHASTTHLSTEAEGKSHDLKIHKHRRFLWEGIVWFSVFIDSQRKRVVVGEEENRRFFFSFSNSALFVARSLSGARFARRCFQKKRKEK